MNNTNKQETLQQIGARLQQLRYENGLKLETVAQEVGIARTVLSRIENGRYPSLKVSILLTLAQFYRVEANTLL
ncbi:MAG: helix-turn-helix domain-containing protein [Chitinophagaceae bacterium]|nr:helix-turn-helix domain-containing protein [Chitinophagaceae bacterium]